MWTWGQVHRLIGLDAESRRVRPVGGDRHVLDRRGRDGPLTGGPPVSWRTRLDKMMIGRSVAYYGLPETADIS